MAALVVVLHHALLTVPALAEPYRDPASAWQHASWFTLGPLHLLWDGPAAVTVFFVLSGMVLAPGFLQRRGRWAVYYPSRLARLYPPVVGAVLLAVALALLVPRRATPELSWWTAAHAQPVTPGSVVHTMLHTRISQLDTPLWSLKWEVRFSLLLPLYVLAARWLGRRAWLLGLAATAQPRGLASGRASGPAARQASPLRMR